MTWLDLSFWFCRASLLLPVLRPLTDSSPPACQLSHGWHPERVSFWCRTGWWTPLPPLTRPYPPSPLRPSKSHPSGVKSFHQTILPKTFKQTREKAWTTWIWFTDIYLKSVDISCNFPFCVWNSKEIINHLEYTIKVKPLLVKICPFRS